MLDHERITVSPVRRVHRVEAHPPISYVDLQSVAVVLHFMDPARPRGRLGREGRSARRDESSRRIAPAARVTRTAQHARHIGAGSRNNPRTFAFKPVEAGMPWRGAARQTPWWPGPMDGPRL